jgi:hypothetical protein
MDPRIAHSFKRHRAQLQAATKGIAHIAHTSRTKKTSESIDMTGLG